MSNPPHLRVVADNEHPVSDTTLANRPAFNANMVPAGWQHSLPFDDAACGSSVIVVSMESMNGAMLRELVSFRRPGAVVDLRELIRFDLPGTNRDDVFRVLRSVQTHYVKDPLPWHRLAPKDFIASERPISQRLIHEVVDRDPRCVMVFVSRRDEARSIAAHLSRVMTERMGGPWCIEEAS